jgi:hypothetical protein
MVEPLAVHTGNENEARMRLLAIIQDFNHSGKSPTYTELSRKKGIVGSVLNWDLSELLDREYIEQIRYQGFVDLTMSSFDISDKGKDALKRYYSKARYFVHRLNDLLERGSIDDLLRYVEDHRDILIFAYHRRLITKEEIEMVAKKLDISTQRIWWGYGQGERGLPSYPDKMIWPSWKFKRNKRKTVVS